MAQRPNYVPVPGSDALITKARGDSAAAVVESAGPASLARADVVVGDNVVVVGPVLLQGRSVPLLLDVMDRIGPLVSVESFVVYLQLYRLAVADGKNACRVALNELSRRTRLKDRRLNKAIADLVRDGHVVLVDRTRDGTLYRLRFPDEATAPSSSTSTIRPPSPLAGEGLGARAKTPTTKVPRMKAPATKMHSTNVTSTTPAVLRPPSPLAGEGLGVRAKEAGEGLGERGTSGTPRSVGDVCAWFAARFGTGPGRSGSDVASCVMELLEEGATFATIPGLLEQFVKTAPKTTPLRDLPRVLARG